MALAIIGAVAEELATAVSGKASRHSRQQAPENSKSGCSSWEFLTWSRVDAAVAIQVGQAS